MDQGFVLGDQFMKSAIAIIIATTSLLVAGCRDCIVELDRMVDTQFPPTSVNRGGENHSIRSVYEAAYIKLNVVHDEDDIPVLSPTNPANDDSAILAEAANAFFDSELDAIRGAHRDLPILPKTFTYLIPFFDVEIPFYFRHFVHGVTVDGVWRSTKTGNTAPQVMGGVFQGVRTTLFIFYGNSKIASQPLKYFRTVAHELGHTFNLHHEDAVEGVTLMNQTQEIDPGWTLEFSAASIDHLINHPALCVWPGPRSNLSFGPEHDLANTHVDSDYIPLCPDDPSPATTGVIAVALPPTVPQPTPKPHQPTGDSWASLRLSVAADRDTYAIGDPVHLTVHLMNSGATPVSVPSDLDPRFRSLSISVATADGATRGIPSIFLFESDVPARPLRPGEEMAEVIPVQYGAFGWTFTRPGLYWLQAEFSDRTGPGRSLTSKAVQIEVIDDLAGAFLVSGTEPSRQAGAFLLWQGGDHLTAGIDLLNWLIDIAPSSSAANSARFALGKSLSHRFKDYSRGLHRPPMPVEAIAYLDGVDPSRLPDIAQLQLEMAHARLSYWRGAEAIDNGQQPEALIHIDEARARLEAARNWILGRPRFEAFEDQAVRIEEAIDRLDFMPPTD